MLRTLSYSVVLASWGLCAGCGLTLDYDPPEDAGGDVPPMDAPPGDGGERDAGGDASACASACTDGTECILGECRHPCTSTEDCHFDDANCEVCDLSAGACIVAEITCDGGCAASCDPTTDRCEANCGAGEACIDDACVEGTPCGGDEDCLALPENDCGPAVCAASGLCEQVTPLVCPGVDYECADVFACVSCDPVPSTEGCPVGEICDVEGGTYQCVECTAADTSACGADAPICGADGECRRCGADRECFERGLGAACQDGVCVECNSDATCTNPGLPFCDLNVMRCVECGRDTDCTVPGEVCRVDSTCGHCSVDEDCPAGTCSAGTCVRGCGAMRECPDTCAGAAIGCDAGGCVYPSGAPSEGACSDSFDCTIDTCDPADPRADGFGCIHTANHDACDDAVDCTIDRCVAVDIGGIDEGGCSHTRSDAICSGTTLDRRCLADLCVGRVGSDTGPITGCMPAYIRPCGVGQICTSEGFCQSALGCARCFDDGLACNGVESCLLGTTCLQTFGTGGCTGECNQFCSSETTCAPRPGGGSAICDIVITLP